MITVAPEDAPFGPWNPGIESQIPEQLRQYCTIFRPDNTFTSVQRATELSDLTGIDPVDLVVFRPSRLALHELLIRVTADLCVPDGTRIEDLGINFRQMVRVILNRYVEARSAEIASLYARLRLQVSALVEPEVSSLLNRTASTGVPAPKDPVRSLLAFFTGRRQGAEPLDGQPGRESRLLAAWEEKSTQGNDPAAHAAYRALAKVVAALMVRHGGVWGGHELIASLATDIACNTWVGDEIGALVDACVRDAVSKEGYLLLPRQDRPMVMNTKGASASGKSTLRPLQKRLAGDLGVNWAEFALISPDIWRKQLIDYDGLGPMYKYAGSFAGDELRIIDQKLDHYMARKAQRGDMSHLLIDRFRFDSFAPDSEEAGSNLLTRFGDTVYLFFMITPPESHVVRAWNRGLDVGRYKAVDDTLGHSVEAYSGMPQVFFTWIRRTDKRVHFEFLDNSVALGERPRTVAFGWNDVLNILDVHSLCDVERYRGVAVSARSESELYSGKTEETTVRGDFVRACLAEFREVFFADQATGRVYLHLVNGIATWRDDVALADALTDSRTRAAFNVTCLAALTAELSAQHAPSQTAPAYLPQVTGAERMHTLGWWGTSQGG